MFVLLVGAALPQTAPDAAVTPTRLPPGTVIRVDGDLDEPVWHTASELSALGMVEPVEGIPSQATRVRLCYDQDAFYVALWCDEDPGQVRGRLMARDARLDPDDRVELWFDTFGDRRFAYWFQIGAGGSKGDALLSDFGLRFNKSWDGIWYAKARVTAAGWQAELAFPFKTLAFKPGATTWGFNLRRLRKVRDEEYRWASPSQAYSFFPLARGGALHDMQGMRQGLGLDVVPFVKARARSDRTSTDHLSRMLDLGGDVFYRVTPSLRLALTYRTDFAETEVDERRVNLTRFPLFFPEKRDFFLEDSSVFEFGVPTGPDGGSGDDPIAFFSRRIGLRAGSEVPVLAGIKLAGQIGPVNVGLLDVVVNDAIVDEQSLGVARVSYNVGLESSVGVIGTLGQPDREGVGSTYGADFALGASDYFGAGRGGRLWGYGLRSTAEDAGGDGGAWGLASRYSSSSWEHRARLAGVDTDFAPALGFVRRTGILTYGGSSEHTWRNDGDAFVRRMQSEVELEYITGLSGERDTIALDVRPATLTFASDDQLSYRAERRFERIPARFELRDGIGVGVGDYWSTRHRVTVQSAQRRDVGLDAEGEVGDFYSGHLARWSLSPKVYLDRYAQLSVAYEEFRVRIDEGQFTTRVTQARADLTFSPDVSWRNLVQYDTDTRDLTAQSRLHWIVEPGQDVYLLAVYGWVKDDRDAPLRPGAQDVSLKVSYTLRF